VETVYFDFDKYALTANNNTILDFIAKADTSKIESVQIYGYCDDRGNADYNYKLSEERVSTVRNLLTANGLSKTKL
jgi:outer membrane protein OmpA-like peptidoglycan-associated protein